MHSKRVVTKRGRKLFNPVEDTSDGRAMLRAMGVTGEKRDRRESRRVSEDRDRDTQRHRHTQTHIDTHKLKQTTPHLSQLLTTDDWHRRRER